MIHNDRGSTLLENVVAISVLCIFIAAVAVISNNLLRQQELSSDFVKMNSVLQNSVEELLNKRYDQVPVGTTNDTVDGYSRTVSVSENINLKNIDITLTNGKGEMKLTIEKGVDIN